MYYLKLEIHVYLSETIAPGTCIMNVVRMTTKNTGRNMLTLEQGAAHEPGSACTSSMEKLLPGCWDTHEQLPY